MSVQANMAVLFIHGILGKPRHFEPFIPLVPPNWSVCNLTLKGHGGRVQDFARVSMEVWKQQVEAALDQLLAGHDGVIIVAHSMGTLFAVQEAIKKPVAELFLLNVPLKVRVTRQLIKTVWRIFWGTLKPDNEWDKAAQAGYSMAADHCLLHYLGWIPRYLELFAEIRRTRKIIRQLTVPTHIYQALKDEMVSPKSIAWCQQSPGAVVKSLKMSGHYYYAPDDCSLLKKDFIEMLDRYRSGGPAGSFAATNDEGG